MSILFNAIFSSIALGHTFVDLLGSQRSVIFTYIGTQLGISNTALGALSMAYVWTQSLWQPFFGWLSDRFDKILMMVLAIATLAVAMLALRFVGTAGDTTLFGYAVLGGVGFGAADLVVGGCGCQGGPLVLVVGVGAAFEFHSAIVDFILIISSLGIVGECFQRFLTILDSVAQRVRRFSLEGFRVGAVVDLVTLLV